MWSLIKRILALFAKAQQPEVALPGTRLARKAARHCIKSGLAHIDPDGELELAIADFSEAIRLDPECVEAYVERGRAYAGTELQEYDRAIADFTEAIRLDPTRAEILVDRGNAYAEREDYDQAIADFTSAIEFEPQAGADSYQTYSSSSK